MKLASLILCCGLAGTPTCFASIVGVWQYDGFIFQGRRYPNPNPELFLTFTFTENKSRLFWQRKNESGHCERIAEYQISKTVLHQKVIWVNPKNHPECAKDPDMKLGSETEVKYQVVDEYLQFYFDINGDEFIYLLKSI